MLHHIQIIVCFVQWQRPCVSASISLYCSENLCFKQHLNSSRAALWWHGAQNAILSWHGGWTILFSQLHSVSLMVSAEGWVREGSRCFAFTLDGARSFSLYEAGTTNPQHLTATVQHFGAVIPMVSFPSDTIIRSLFEQLRWVWTRASSGCDSSSSTTAVN